jgi:hypothetical protein
VNEKCAADLSESGISDGPIDTPEYCRLFPGHSVMLDAVAIVWRIFRKQFVENLARMLPSIIGQQNEIDHNPPPLWLGLRLGHR